MFPSCNALHKSRFVDHCSHCQYIQKYLRGNSVLEDQRRHCVINDFLDYLYIKMNYTLNLFIVFMTKELMINISILPPIYLNTS